MQKFVHPAVFGAVIALSWAAVFIKMAGDVPPLAIAFWRMLIASVVWAPFYFFHDRKNPERRPLTGRQKKLIILAGIFLCLHFTTWITSLRHTTVASAVFLILLQPVLVAFAAHFFLHERLNRNHFVAMGLTVLGAAIITWGDVQFSPEYLFGDFLAFLGVILAGAYNFAARLARPDHPEHGLGVPLHRYLPLVYFVATFGLLILCLITGQSLGPYSPEMWWILVALGLIPTVIGHSIFNWAMRYLPILSVNIALVGEPIGSTLFAWWILKEVPQAGIFIGGPLMILAVVMVVLRPPVQRRH
ncbi:MAG: DMT family transporter [bacterium]|nr:DMT family transporter [bacterium]